MRPPYLLHRQDLGSVDGVTVELDPDTSIIVLTVHGIWGPSLKREVSVAILRCLSGHPATLVIDLQAMADPRAASVPTWINAQRTGQETDPAVRVVVSASPDSALAQRLQRLGAERFLPVFASMPSARAAAAQRLPVTGRLSLRLPAGPSAAAVARAAATDVCTAWRMTHLRERACVVITELVRNAVLHAGSPVDVLLSRRGDGIHLAVRDGGKVGRATIYSWGDRSRPAP